MQMGEAEVCEIGADRVVAPPGQNFDQAGIEDILDVGSSPLQGSGVLESCQNPPTVAGLGPSRQYER